MAELYSGYRIYCTDEREKIVPVAFPFDAILHIRSSKGVGLDFENQDPKTEVSLTQGRSMWLLVRYSVFKRLWEAYLTGDSDDSDESEAGPKPIFISFTAN